MYAGVAVEVCHIRESISDTPNVNRNAARHAPSINFSSRVVTRRKEYNFTLATVVPAPPNRIVSSGKVRDGKRGDGKSKQYADTIATLEKPDQEIAASAPACE
jgi:hypothetical protein